MSAFKIGSRLKVFTDDGVYEGLVSAVDLKGTGKDDRVTLCKAVSLDIKKPLPSLLHFYTSDIKKFEIITEPKAEGDCNAPKLVNLCSKVTPAHLLKLQNIDHEKLSFSWQLGTNEEQKSSSSDGPEEANAESQTDYTIIDKLNETFQNAVFLLKQHTVIGLAIQGVCISRRGQLSWLQIGIKKHSFLFDVLALGQEAFDLGLREILESHEIQKVVYNCRGMSDMLCHQYSVLLTNVFDIQVAEVTVFADRNGGKLPWYVNSLPICLMQNLKLKEDEVFFQRARMYNREKDESVWVHRPATKEMIDAACKNVKYLCALRCVMLEEMLKDLIVGTNIYLSAYRNLSNKDFDKMRSECRQMDSLPTEFRRFSYQKHSSESKFVENCRMSLDPVLHVSHDGISHGRKSSRELDERHQMKQMSARVRQSKSVGEASRKPDEPKLLMSD